MQAAGFIYTKEDFILQELSDEQLEQITGAFGVYGLYSQVFPSVSTGTSIYANSYANGVNSGHVFTTTSSITGPVGGGALSLGIGFGSALAR